jgi:hypothetical protein
MMNSTLLTRVPLVLSVVWRSETVTTDPPHYPRHQEWSLEVTVAASQAVHIAAFLEDPSTCLWGLRPGPASTDGHLTASFFPYSWADSDDVQINFAWQRLKVTDSLLKQDPRTQVQVIAPSVADAGELVEVATIPSHAVTLSIMAVAAQDTEQRRLDRWRIKPRFRATLPARVVPLTSGRQNGISDLQDPSDS